MDREEAQFILRSFRPCGSDAEDPAFAEALALAVKDQELSEWLVTQRAFDSQFSECLNAVKVPEELKEQIADLFSPHLSENTAEEKDVIGALATIEPPAALRGEILNAMHIAAQSKEPRVKTGKWNNIIRFAFPLAIAATIAMGVFIGFFSPKSGVGEYVSAKVMAEESMKLLSSEDFSLDHNEKNYLKLVSWASEKEMPTPSALPASLMNTSTIGCKQLNIDGHPASLICFQSDEYGVLHLVVMDADQAAECMNSLPCMKRVKECCGRCPESGCTTAQWQHDGKAYMLISKATPVEDFQEIF